MKNNSCGIKGVVEETSVVPQSHEKVKAFVQWVEMTFVVELKIMLVHCGCLLAERGGEGKGWAVAV